MIIVNIININIINFMIVNSVDNVIIINYYFNILIINIAKVMAITIINIAGPRFHIGKELKKSKQANKQKSYN